MRRLFLILFLLAYVGRVSVGWLASDPPEGHVESTTVSDASVYMSTTTTITSLMGTAQKDGGSQAAANVALNSYELYLWWDLDKDGEADAGDEPIGATTLSTTVNDSVGTFVVTSTATFLSSGFFVVESELIEYTGKTTTSFTGCVRGVNETTAAAHTAPLAITAVQAWKKVVSVTTDGSPYNALGYDSSGVGVDDGTEGNLIQAAALNIGVAEGRAYLLKLRVVDANGNTSTEDTGDVDRLYSHGVSCYLGEDGDAVQGLEDDEVLRFRVNKKPRRFTR